MLRNQGGHEGQQPGAQLELERVCRVYLQVVPLLPQHDVELVEEVDPGARQVARGHVAVGAVPGTS